MNRILCASLTFALCVCAAAAQQEADFQTDGNGTITGYIGSVKDVVIPATIGGKPVTAIGDDAFAFNELENVTIPASVTAVGERSFEANRLASVTIPASVTIIGDNAFAYNSMLKEILCGAGNPAYTSVDGVLFSKDGKTLVAYPSGRRNGYIIPNSVMTIRHNAFFSSNLISVTIPASVISIDKYAFGHTPQLKEILCDTGNPAYTSIDGVLFSKNGKTLVAYPAGKGKVFAIPNSVVSIGETVFVLCNLTGVIIPDSVTSIGYGAFEGNSLTSVTIPASVTAIGGSAFEMNRLASVTIGGNVVVDDSAFDRALFALFDDVFAWVKQD
ncbi:MAG: hypothetical protein Pg6C_00380 [Treponemataceae bacterium]|nr:MAG: hypothetical protein Pg6C_00380 [Treponemataceae bacterium]